MRKLNIGKIQIAGILFFSIYIFEACYLIATLSFHWLNVLFILQFPFAAYISLVKGDIVNDKNAASIRRDYFWAFSIAQLIMFIQYILGW